MSVDNAEVPAGGQNTPERATAGQPLLRSLEARRDSDSLAPTPAGEIARNPAANPVRPKAPRRHGEDPRLWFRTDRVFFQSGGWYISTREGIDVGPYLNAAAARRDEKVLIKLLTRSSQNGFDAQALVIRQFISRPRHGH